LESHEISYVSLVVIATLAFLVPIAVSKIKRFQIPVVVGELIAGIVVGKSGLDIVHAEEWLTFLSTLGITYLMFLSGVEIDFDLLQNLSRKADGRRLFGTTILYLTSVLALGLAAGYGLRALGLVQNPALIALILATCSVGIVVSTVKENHLSATEYGQTILVTALLLDFITMILLTVLVVVETTGDLRELGLIGVLFMAVFAVYLAGGRLRHKPFMQELAHATSQIGVRGSFMLIFIFSFLSDLLGVEVILGAFLAGAIVSIISHTDETSLHLKLDAIGYGFLVPIFFIMVGAAFDIIALLASPRSLVLAPLMIASAYLVKVIPGALFAGRFGARESFALSILVTPGLSLAVAAAEIGFRLDLLSPSTHSAVILLAIVTAAVSPVLFGKLSPAAARAPSRRIVIVGASERGLLLAKRFADFEENLLLVDRDLERVAQAESRGFKAAQIDASDPADWRKIELDRNTTVVIATQEDELNRKAAELLRAGFEVDSIICQINNPEYAEALKDLDVYTVSPAFAPIALMENMARNPGLFALLNRKDDNVAIQEAMVTNADLAGRAVRELNLPGDTLILAIRRGREHIIPRGETRLRLYDILTLSGTPAELERTIEQLNA